jgi:class 3 adenylate cyclase
VAVLSVHVVVYLVLNGLFVALWLLLGDGTVDDLRTVISNPTLARTEGFWPVWTIVVWGAILLIHAGVYWSFKLFGSRARKRRWQRTRRFVREMRRHERARGPRRGDGSASVDADRRRATDREWVTVMFTDIVNSTPLAEALGDESFRSMITSHRALVRACVDEHDGVEVSTKGDGFFLRFTKPTDAVDCAMSLQRRLTDLREQGAFVPRIRVGLHAGEALRDEDDLIGRVINLAARVMDHAVGDEILVTEQVADHSDADIDFLDRGLVPLKGFPQPRHLLAVIWQDDDERPVVVLDDGFGGLTT